MDGQESSLIELSEKEKQFKQAIRNARKRLWIGRTSNSRSTEAAAQATFAQLRGAVGRKPEADPLAWELALENVIDDFPRDCVGHGDRPSVYERAAFDALTLYALHQQSLSVSMYESQVSVGKAVAMLANQTESKSIKQRFDALLTATTIGAIDYHLRTLIALLNDREIRLDHAELALDLVKLQSPKRRDAVRLRWGRDFARILEAAYSKQK